MYQTGGRSFYFDVGSSLKVCVSSAGVGARVDAGVLQLHRLSEATDALQLQRLGDAAATQPAAVK